MVVHPFEALHVLQHHLKVALVVHQEGVVDDDKRLNVVSEGSVRLKKTAYQSLADVGDGSEE